MKSISQPTDGSKAEMSIGQVYIDITETTTKAIEELTESDVAIYCDEYRRPGWLLAQLRNHDRAISRPAKPKQRKRRSTTRRSTNRRSQTAAQVFQSQIADGLAETLDRVNGDDEAYPSSRVIPFVRTQSGKIIMMAA